MKTLLVSPYSLSRVGGVQGQVIGLARALRRLGVDARVVGPCDGPPPGPGITSVGPSTGMSSNGSIAPVAVSKQVAARTVEALRVTSPDVVHVHEPLVPGPTQTAVLTSEVPVIATLHAASDEGLSHYRTFRRPLRAILERVAVRTAVSPEAQRLAVESFGGEYRVLYNGVDVDSITSVAPWPATKPALLFVGRHEPRKGLDVLLDAFDGLDRDAVLWVAGEGSETEALQRRAPPGVEWLGRISEHEKARRLRGAQVYVAPSLRGESFGMVLLEAMAADTALVAADIPGYVAVARPDVEALIVPPGDADALRVTLRRLLDEPATRDRLVTAGARRADDLSMAHLAEEYLRIYESTLADVASAP